MLKEFKEFAFKGNLIDMAVGIIIGGAFGTVVKSLVDNIMMPPLGKLISGVDFKNMKTILEPAVMEGEKVIKPEVALNYGQFFTDFLSFILLALAVFIVVKKVLVAMKKEEAKPEPAPPEPTAEEKLLAEIRDLLKSQN
ncbi:large-conductance mechanosensitive channel protein MscL [Haloferula rosea]|uniref:Large-conductance mechanosensitive channel n=2 Tax=Haloferula rosea TaxID=490093 RepID=A0A934REC0_9BACT|nr:large-conductance mechanosensitive channel protein MscL [Haloferula rosea]MBK1827982.1 large-conductance mechanosensitive channel protein MscL [Haloferula rosea]